jgi:phosphomannomutase
MDSPLALCRASSSGSVPHIERAELWASIDPHAPTRTHVEELVAAALAGDAAASASLEGLFSSTIQFGTAGMRGPMEAGSAGLNYVTALRMAQGTCKMLLSQATTKGQTAADVSVVIGFDHRSNAANGINSKSIAAVISAAFLSRGVRVHLFSDFCHTPLVPFTVQALSASLGIMVTASHNPKLDNGIKVYVESLFFLNPKPQSLPTP